MKRIFFLLALCVLTTIFLGTKVRAPHLREPISHFTDSPGCAYERARQEYYLAYFYAQDRIDLARTKALLAQQLLNHCPDGAKVLQQRVSNLLKVLSP